MEPIPLKELKTVNALYELPDEHLQWLLDHSEYQEFEDGALIGKYGEVAEYMWFLLEGKVTFFMNVNGRLVYYYTFENNASTGGVSGLIPYSRMKTYPGNSYATGKVRSIALHKKHFHELEDLNPDFIQKLIGYMTERAKAFATTQLQQEKVSALGKLAAGIAHELNNPAAAINGISNELTQRLNRNYELTESLLAGHLLPEQIRDIGVMVQKKENDLTLSAKPTLLQRMENEENLKEWLSQMDIPNSMEASETFSEAGYTAVELETICKKVGREAAIHALQWLENLLSSQKIIKDLGNASARISHLVAAIKSHVHMDRTGDIQSTNLHQDIENTLTLFGYKLREKNITVRKKFSDHMIPVPAYVSELNQVWTNIIDNAIYALDKNGELTIETSVEYHRVRVSIIDNGPGIPKEIRSRIFDPFFTTKKVGDGTGIGLDMVNRAIKHHNGEIKVTSDPGRTEFAIYLPIEEKPEG